MNACIILGFGGQFQPASMAEFARHRAARLSLALDLLELTETGARMAVTGPADLTDAFVMALSLGPRDCLVRDVWRESVEGPGSARTRRQE